MIQTYSQSTAESRNQFWWSLLPDLDIVATEYFSVTRSLCHNQLSWLMSCDLVLTLSYIEEEARHSDFSKVTQGSGRTGIECGFNRAKGQADTGSYSLDCFPGF